jgi:Flp pilus assembly protein TadG
VGYKIAINVASDLIADNTMLKRLFGSLRHNTDGSVLVEAAVVLPVMVPLVLGVLEFSWYFQKQQLVESGVRDAARYLARTAEDTTPPTDPCDNATFVANAKSIAVTGVISGGTARVPGWTVGSVTICPTTFFDNSASTYLGPSKIYLITVSTTFADPALGFFSALGLTTPNLSASHTERSIGPG